MEIDQIETFLAVVTYGGFHRAAAALRVSQPAVSARVRALEDSLGVKLFSRVHGGLSVSPAGKALRPHAEQLLRDVARARQADSRNATIRWGRIASRGRAFGLHLLSAGRHQGLPGRQS